MNPARVAPRPVPRSIGGPGPRGARAADRLRGARRVGAALVLAAGLLGAASPAQAAGVRVVVGDFSGPTASKLRARVVRTLAERSEIRLVTAGELAARTEPRAEALDALGVAASVRGDVVREGGRWMARLEVLHRATGEVAARLRVPSANIRALPAAVAERLWSSLGSALTSAPAPKVSRRVVLMALEGPSGGARQVRAVLSDAPWLEVLDPATLGLREPPRAERRARLARDEDLDGFLSLRLVRRRGRWTATGEVVGPDGQTAPVRARARRSRRLGAALLDPLAQALGAVEPALPPAPEPPAPPIAAAAPKRSTPSAEGRSTSQVRAKRARPGSPGPRVRLAASARLFGRDLSYDDEVTGGLRPYSLGAAPMVRLEAAWFPWAAPRGLRLGVEAQGDLAFGLSSRDDEGRSFGTSALGFLAGVRGGWGFGALRLGAAAGLGLDRFAFDAAEDGQPPDVPDAEYLFVRAGADVGYRPLSALHLDLRLGYRFVLSPGGIADAAWFPNASVGGLDALLRVAYALGGGFELTAEGELERYFASLDAEPGAVPSAGGLTDQMYSFALGAAFRF